MPCQNIIEQLPIGSIRTFAVAFSNAADVDPLTQKDFASFAVEVQAMHSSGKTLSGVSVQWLDAANGLCKGSIDTSDWPTGFVSLRLWLTSGTNKIPSKDNWQIEITK